MKYLYKIKLTQTVLNQINTLVYTRAPQCAKNGETNQMTSLRMRSDNNGKPYIYRKCMRAVDQKPDYQLEWPK